MKTPKNKLHSLLLILPPLILTTLLVALVGIVDPWQIFHEQTTPFTTRYWDNQRYTNAGIINTSLAKDEGKTIIWLGTSMTENFITTEVAELLGYDKAVRLCISGGSPYEQYAVFDHALKTGRIDTVLWEVGNFIDGNEKRWRDDYKFPAYLYTDSFKDKLTYLTNLKAAEQSVNLLFGQGKWEVDIDKTSFWMDEHCKRGSFAGFLKQVNFDLRTPKLNTQIEADFPLLAEMKEYIRAHKEISFVLFLPPYSMYYRQVNADQTGRYLAYIRKLVSLAEQETNVSLYGFDILPEITGNLANYIDPTHFGLGVSRFILKSINSGLFKLSKENVEGYIRVLTEQIQNYAPNANTNNTIAFEGPVNEKAFTAYPPPHGPVNYSPEEAARRTRM